MSPISPTKNIYFCLKSEKVFNPGGLFRGVEPVPLEIRIHLSEAQLPSFADNRDGFVYSRMPLLNWLQRFI